MEEPKMKRFIKKLSALMIAAMLVIMSVSVPVQAKTITQPNRIITLYSGNKKSLPNDVTFKDNLSLSCNEEIFISD